MKFWNKSKTPASVLGLSLNGTQVDGVVVRRANGSTQLGSPFHHTFSADPLTGDPQVLGRELQAALDAAEIRERQVTVALSASWALTLLMPLPDLPEADALSFLQLEAERGFTIPPEALTIASSRFKTPAGIQMATQIAIQRDRISRLEAILRGARLLPVSLTLGSPRLIELLGDTPDTGALTMIISPTQAELVVSYHQGVVALRTWELPMENPGRELRLTLAQLPPEVVPTLKSLRLVGVGPGVDSLAADLQVRATALGLTVSQVTQYGQNAARLRLPAGAPVNPATAVAAAFLADLPTPFEFLPPKISAWQEFSKRYTSHKLVAIGQVVGVVLILLLVAFGWQQFQLSSLNSKWTRIAPRVHEVDDLQAQIKKFRPWYDTSVRSLVILRRLTEAFPEDGIVTAKIIEIRENGLVTCSGTARDQAALLQTMERLRSAKDVADVQLDMVRGKAPMQFTFNFQWAAGAR